MNFTHSGGAGGNCNPRTVLAYGTGPAQGGVTPITAIRMITVSVNLPTAPTANNDSTTIAYSTGATTIDLGSIGAVSGLIGTGTSVTLGTLEPQRGLALVHRAGHADLYRERTVYAPTVQLTYNVTGPCNVLRDAHPDRST